MVWLGGLQLQPPGAMAHFVHERPAHVRDQWE